MDDHRVIFEASVGALVSFVLGIILDVFQDPGWTLVYIMGAIMVIVALIGEIPLVGAGRPLVWQQSAVFAALGLTGMVVSAFGTGSGSKGGEPALTPAISATVGSADRPPGCIDGNPVDAAAAGERAREISVLEANLDFDALYDLMHPDARAVLPREVVVGWYREEFRDKRTAQATVHDMCFLREWTWEKTCAAYPYTAVVLFDQPFWVHDERQPDPDKALTLHLVRSSPGEWGWFLGRTRAYVDEQIATFGSATALPVTGGTAAC